MDTVTRHDLEELTRERTGMCVSLYLTTHAAGSEARQDPINLNNMLAAVQDELVSLGMGRPDARNFIRPARAVVSDNAFWQAPGRGVALFLAEDFIRQYRLPIAFEDMLGVSGSFHLTPLLPLLTGESEYYLLVLSQSKVRLFRGNRFGLGKVNVPGLPDPVKQAVSQEQNESYRQSQAGTGKDSRLTGRRDDENISRYFPRISEGIQALLGSTTPLVLAGVPYLLSLYRQANTYQALLPEEIAGDLDALRAEALHQKAWPVVEPLVRRNREEILKELKAKLGTAKASTSTPDIVSAAYQGRVTTLAVSAKRHEWGKVDRSRGGAVSTLCRREEEGCEDLYDLAAVQTLLKGGKVLVLEGDQAAMPAPLAALLRR